MPKYKFGSSLGQVVFVLKVPNLWDHYLISTVNRMMNRRHVNFNVFKLLTFLRLNGTALTTI